MTDATRILKLSYVLSAEERAQISLKIWEDKNMFELSECIQYYIKTNDYPELGRIWLGLNHNLKEMMMKMILQYLLTNNYEPSELTNTCQCDTYSNTLTIPNYLSSSDIHPYSEIMLYKHNVSMNKKCEPDAIINVCKQFELCIEEIDMIETYLKDKEIYLFSCIEWAMNACVLVFLTDTILDDVNQKMEIDMEKFISAIHKSLNDFVQHIENDE